MKISTSHVAAFVAALVAAGAPLGAQSSTQGSRPATANPIPRFDPTGSGDTSIFAPLNLPTGNIYRSGAGSPGPKYWQQRADYDLHGTLDTAAKALRGEMTLRYTNNSPDTLRFVWFQVEQNAFKNKSLNSYVFPPESRFGARNFEGGDVIDRFNQVAARRAKRPALKTRVEGTVMKVDLADAARRRDRRRRSTSRGTSTFPSTAPIAWAATARSTSSRSGIRASASTTICAAGTPSRTSGRASSISSTATTTSRSPFPRATSSPRRARCRTPPRC